MASILDTVLPVFGLIALGFIAARVRIADAATSRGLAQFVFNIAIPAFLFRTIALIEPQVLMPWGLWLAFFGGIALVWLITAAIAPLVPALAAEGGSAASMAASFGNLVMLGTPLALAHFGPPAAVPAGLILSIHAPALWFAATLHREMARAGSHVSLVALISELILGLSKNAIVLALLAGAIWRMTGFGLHPVPGAMLKMLSDASVPTALFALGLSLAGYSLKGAWSAMAVLIALKMLLLPAAVWGLVTYAVSLPPLWIKVAVLLAAIPTGANAFLFASRHDAAIPAVSGAIALGTALAAATVTALLYWME